MNSYQEILLLLKELHKEYPSCLMSKHLSTAFDGYNDIWGLSDKELLFALTKYKTEMELDIPHVASEEDVEAIIKGGMNLFIDEQIEEGEE